MGFVVLAFCDSRRGWWGQLDCGPGDFLGRFTFRVVARASFRSWRPWWAELGVSGCGEGLCVSRM